MTSRLVLLAALAALACLLALDANLGFAVRADLARPPAIARCAAAVRAAGPETPQADAACAAVDHPVQGETP